MYRNMIFTNEIDIEAYSKINKLLKKYPFVAKKVAVNLYTADENYYEITKDWEEYAYLYTHEREQLLEYEDQYNDVAWKFYQKINNPIYLQKAIGWMQKIIASKPQPNYYYTLAHLLSKTKDKNQAMKMQQKAIDLMKQSKEDVSLYMDALEKIKKSN